jgi:hypothetical protein
MVPTWCKFSAAAISEEDGCFEETQEDWSLGRHLRTVGHPWDDGGHSGIRSITLSYDRCIDSIRLEYDRDGLAVPGERHGGADGNHTTQACTRDQCQTLYCFVTFPHV